MPYRYNLLTCPFKTNAKREWEMSQREEREDRERIYELLKNHITELESLIIAFDFNKR